jgi:RimJ/RimL family protein N-acetyltransferase
MKTPEIRTNRLVLRPPLIEDAGAIFRGWAQNHEVTKYLTWMPHKDISDTIEYLRRTLNVQKRNKTKPLDDCSR